jgi:hypothetical protein
MEGLLEDKQSYMYEAWVTLVLWCSGDTDCSVTSKVQECPSNRRPWHYLQRGLPSAQTPSRYLWDKIKRVEA